MRKLATAAAVSLALASGGAFGLGLGDIDMRSALNQPMNAEIPLTSVKAGELEGMIVKLADEDAFARAGIERSSALTDLAFSVDQSGPRPVIRVSSRRPVTEPFLNFLLEVDWTQGRMVREYTVLLDPPVFMTQGPSVRDSRAERPAVAGGDSALVAPAPIERDATRDGFDVELVGNGAEVSDDALLGGSDAGGEVVSLDDLAAEAGATTDRTASVGGEVVPLTDLEAPNTDAAAERAARAADAARAQVSDDLFEVEIVGEGIEVGDDVGAESAASEAASGGGEVVSLDDLEAPADSSAGGDAAPEEVTVRRGDTLFEIAERNAPRGVSVQQMMLALLEANRSAFINDNINLVRAGSILRVPQAAEARALSQAQALAEIGRQNDLWRQYRDNLRNSTADTQIARGPDAGAADDTDAAGPAEGESDVEAGLSEDARAILEAAREEVRRRDELSIVADDTSATTTASATADETEGNDAARLGEINRRLQLAREEMAATRVEGDDLGEQAEELQSTSENLDALVSLRQNEIAKLEAQLADAREAAESGAAGVVGDIEDAAGETAADASAAANALGNAAGDGAGAVGEAVADAGRAAGEAAGDAAGAAEDALGEGAADVENALSAAGTELESVELVGEDSDADGQAALDAADEAAATTAATAAATVEGPWYQQILQDPTRLAIAGAGALGLIGVIGTLLWRRRRQEDDDPLAGFHDEDVEFVDDAEAAEFRAEVDAQATPVADGHVEGDRDVGGVAPAAAAGAAGLAGAAAGAAAFGADDDTAAADATGGESLDKDDTISEVDVYLAYGLHGQAEELLTKAMQRQPENMEYAEKLLQTYHAQGNGEGYKRAAEDYHARFGGESNPAWAGIAEMGRDLRPNEALFAAGAGGVAAIGTGRLDGPQLDDEDFLAGSGEETVSSSVNRDFDAAEETLDFDMTDAVGTAVGGDALAESGDDVDLEDESDLMDQSLDPAFAFDEADLEATGDFSQIANELAAERDGTLDFPGLGDDPTPTPTPADAASDPLPLAEMPDEHSLDEAMTLDELDLDSTSSIAANDTRALDDDLSLELDELAGEIDLDATSVDGTDFLDEAELGAAADGSTSLDTQELDGLEIPDFEGDEALMDATGAPLEGGDEMDTMMDLAKAYIDMGDKDSASNALDEIVKSGSPEQVSEAETLLRKIS